MDSEGQARALVGTTVADKYRVLDVIGAGGMGTVYLAEHVFTKRRVALKRMHPELGRSKLAAERFIRESRAPSAIGHPGIVQVLDGGSQPDGSLYIVHELLAGISVSDAVAHKALSASAVIQLGIELLHALAAAHAKGIIHRDIKPDNVFIAQDGGGGVCIKLLDFGIASLRDTGESDRLTHPGAVLGTAQYMSPEQATAAPVDERSDLWSVGALLYRALSGHVPYPGNTYSAVIYALASKQHVPLAQHRPDLPEALVSVVERALRKPAGERFGSATQMAAALAAVSLEAAEQGEARRAETLADASRAPLVAAAQRSRRDASVPVPGRSGRTFVAVSSTAAASGAGSGQAARTPARIGFSVVAGTMLLCTLTWLVLRERETHAASGQLSAAVEPEAAPALREAPQARPSAALQPVASEPGLPLSALAPVLGARRAELDRCLQESVVSQLLAGTNEVTPYRLDVSLHVATSGRVQSAELSGAAPADLLSCLRTQLLAATFPEASAPTVFEYPLVLTPTVVGR